MMKFNNKLSIYFSVKRFLHSLVNKNMEFCEEVIEKQIGSIDV